PTIRLVEKGTFEEFRRWKCDKAGILMAQVKVPVVLSDETSKEWFLSKFLRSYNIFGHVLLLLYHFRTPSLK
ncbi:hypothetical protein K503DRAFT_773745, partial [Rhizopogon vinicolor AM-OR11-026]